MSTANKKTAKLYRMSTDKHTCPYGLKSKDLLQREGFEVEDHILANREETDAFKEKHDVETTPQTFIDGERIGGYEALRKHLGKSVKDPNKKTYRPVIVLFVMAAFTAIAASFASSGHELGDVFTVRTIELFVAFAMVFLALLKIQDVESFSTMFLNYDLLAKRWVPYGYVYPFAEGLAGVLMVSGALTWIAAPVALFIGTIGAVSVFKAVYVDKRELKCACVGGGNNVPLGFISLTENLMMVAMAVYMCSKLLL